MRKVSCMNEAANYSWNHPNGQTRLKFVIGKSFFIWCKQRFDLVRTRQDKIKLSPTLSRMEVSFVTLGRRFR